MADEVHRFAVLGILNDLGQTVYDGVVPATPTYPYVLVYFAIGNFDESSLTGLSDTKRIRVYTHSVGKTAAAAALVAEAVEGALLNVRPDVTGRSSSMVRMESAPMPDYDESTGQLIVDAVQLYTFNTWPL